jgi:hypothetical protein
MLENSGEESPKALFRVWFDYFLALVLWQHDWLQHDVSSQQPFVSA